MGVRDHVRVQVISAPAPQWIEAFTGLGPAQFNRLVGTVRRRGSRVLDGRPGRQWGLPLADRVLLVAACYRTNLTMRQVALLFGSAELIRRRVVALPARRAHPPRPAAAEQAGTPVNPATPVSSRASDPAAADAQAVPAARRQFNRGWFNEG